MKRWALALVAVLASTPSWAADSYHTVSLSGAGVTSTDVLVAVCDSTHIVVVDRGASSPTAAGRLYAWASGVASVTTFNMPSPSVTYGHTNMLGCNGTNIVAAGSAEATNGTEWIAFSTIAAPGTWTIRRQQTNTGYTVSWSGIASSGPGAKEWTLASYYDPGTDRIYGATIDIVSALAFGNDASKDTGGENFTDQCSGVKVSSTYYLATCVGNSTSYLLGFDGSTTKLFDYSTFGTCTNGPATANSIIRQPFAFNGVGISVSYNSTAARTYFCGATSAASKSVDQNVASLDLRPGVDFTFPSGSRAAYVWTTGGVAYKGGGTASSYFSDETGSTHDIACDSGTVINVAQGVDADGDSTTTDDLVAFCTSGNLEVWGTDCVDADGDGYGATANPFCTHPTPTDCNDASASVYPGATEIAGNGIDEDCSGADTPLGVGKPTSLGRSLRSTLRSTL